MKMKGKKIAPIRYVLFQRAHDDFLGKVEEDDELTRYAWTPHPHLALKYETFERAEAVAHRIVAGKPHDYQLDICELHETDDQYGVNRLVTVFPVGSSSI